MGWYRNGGIKMNSATPADEFVEQDKTRRLWDQIQKWKEARKNGKVTARFKHGKITTIEITQIVE